MPRNSDYKNNPQALEEINPPKGVRLKRKICMEYSHHLTAKTDGIVSFAPFI